MDINRPCKWKLLIISIRERLCEGVADMMHSDMLGQRTCRSLRSLERLVIGMARRGRWKCSSHAPCDSAEDAMIFWWENFV